MTAREAEPGTTATRDRGPASARRVAMSPRDEEILRSLVDRIDPDDAGAHNNLGVVFYQKGLIDDAIRAFERALELDPRLDVARANVELAYLDSGHFRERVESLRARIRRDPDDADAKDALARTYLLAGRPEEAAREWARLLKDRPDNAALHMKLAYARAQEGRRLEAVALVERALMREPGLPALHLQRAELLHEAGEGRAAEAAVRRSLELDRESARGYLLLARILEAKGSEDEAAEALKRATQLDPGIAYEEQHLSLERYLAGRGRSGRPEAVDASLGRLARASQMRRAGRLDAAAAELERAVAVDDAFEARQALAEVRLLQGRPEDAVEVYGALLEAEDSSPKLWNEWGVALHRLGRIDEAIGAYRNAVARDHRYVLAWNNLGVARAQLGEDAPAERALRKAGEGATTPEVLWNLGLFANLRGDVREAVELYTEAVRRDETVAESWNRLGGALFQADRREEAREALERALELDPELAEARYQLGFVLSALGDFKGALRETKRALARASVLPVPRYQLLVDVRFEAGSIPAPDAEVDDEVAAGQPIPSFEFDPTQLDAAFDALGGGPAAAPGEAEERVRKAEAALRRGRTAEAADHAARAVALAPGSPEARLVQGRVYLEQGLAGEALERYTEVLEAGGDAHAPEAAEGRVRALLALDRARDAVLAARRAVELGAPTTLLGRALLEAGEAETAVRVYEAAESLAGADRRAYAEALLAAGRPADAERVFREVVKESPGAAARVGLARTLKALGNDDAAESVYADAVRALPSYAPAALELAELRWRRGHRDAALRGLVSFLELDPRHVDGLVLLGTWLYESDRVLQAARALERAVRLDPTHGRAAEELARVRGGD